MHLIEDGSQYLLSKGIGTGFKRFDLTNRLIFEILIELICHPRERFLAVNLIERKDLLTDLTANEHQDHEHL